MLSYSVAIRTLGGGGEIFRRELESVAAQTVQPDRIVIYIAEGHARPEFRIGREEYRWVKKGMMSQRLLPYDELESDCILMLDDDVELRPDSAARMLAAMQDNDADCVGADTFENHRMPAAAKIRAAAVNLVFPHRSDKWAFRIHRNGSFSYNSRPVKSFYLSQSCAGNAMLWRKSAYKNLHLEDELWLDEFPFAYCDDMLESYKVYKNGFRLGVLYDSGISHLDARSASATVRRDSKWLETRAAVQFIIWWRTCFMAGDTGMTGRVYSCICFCCKGLWQLFVMAGISVVKASPYYLTSYVSGLKEGRAFVRRDGFKALRPYVFMKNKGVRYDVFMD